MDPNSSRILLGAAGGGGLPAIGEAFEGGYFAGVISNTANGVATHGLIVAPRATGATGIQYPSSTYLKWKTSDTTTNNTTSVLDGAANTAAMIAAGASDHPAAQFCNNLNIGGFSDWYLPAIYELEIAYFNLKPSTDSNTTVVGVNDFSVPKRVTTYTSGTPAQTSAAAFQPGGGENFATTAHWSSTQQSTTAAWLINFTNGSLLAGGKSLLGNVRAFRKFAL